MRCKTCHYSLEGLRGRGNRCPECGRLFDPRDPSTFDANDSPASDLWVLWIALIFIAFIGGGLAFLFATVFWWSRNT